MFYLIEKQEDQEMPQVQLPIFPAGVVHITHELAVETRDGRVTYFNGMMPVFSHDESDIRTFRMITAQFCVNGNAKQAEICRAFGVTFVSLKRAVKLYREKGPAGFFEPRNTRGATVLTKPVLAEAQSLFNEGYSKSQVAQKLGLKKDTLRKAVNQGRLTLGKKKRASR